MAGEELENGEDCKTEIYAVLLGDHGRSDEAGTLCFAFPGYKVGGKMLSLKSCFQIFRF